LTVWHRHGAPCSAVSPGAFFADNDKGFISPEILHLSGIGAGCGDRLVLRGMGPSQARPFRARGRSDHDRAASSVFAVLDQYFIELAGVRGWRWYLHDLGGRAGLIGHKRSGGCSCRTKGQADFIDSSKKGQDD